MSRYSAPRSTTTSTDNASEEAAGHIEYGFDKTPIRGYFATVFNEGETPVDYDTRELMAIDNHVSRGGLLKVMEDYDVPEEHRKKIVLDHEF